MNLDSLHDSILNILFGIQFRYFIEQLSFIALNARKFNVAKIPRSFYISPNVVKLFEDTTLFKFDINVV